MIGTKSPQKKRQNNDFGSILRKKNDLKKNRGPNYYGFVKSRVATRTFPRGNRPPKNRLVSGTGRPKGAIVKIPKLANCTKIKFSNKDQHWDPL